MSQVDLNKPQDGNQQTDTNVQPNANMQQGADNYQDPLATADNGQPAKKGNGTGAAVGSAIGSFVLFKFFGVFGAIICFAGFWAVYGIAKSKLPLAARILLCILTTIVFIVILLGVSVIIATIVS